MTQRARPICKIVPESQRYQAIAMRSLNFDGIDLVIGVQGSDFSFANLIFRHVTGFRVLDERDLCEFWPEYSEPKGWLWEVHAGGWMELERQRQFFSSPSVLSPLREFFVVEEHCISVLCRNPPEIIDRGVTPGHA